MDNNQLSTTSKNGMAVAVREYIAISPVAKRMCERMANEIPIKAYEAVVKSDRDITTAAMSVRSLEPSVRQFANIYGERALSALILSHLTLVEDLANVSRPLKPEAMAMLAKSVTKMLMDDDVSINLADLQIVSDRLVKGEAGQVYGGLNSQIVTKAFADYICEKAGEFSAWREEKAKEHAFGSFGLAGSKEFERLKYKEASSLYRDGTLQKDIKQD